MAEIRKLKNYINGEWVESKTDQYEDVVNPATKEVMCQVPISTREDVEYAVRSASEAFQTWSKTAVPRRARILFNYQQLLQQNKEELARLITLENGKNTT
ncbi:aldehyde dehydrogenase family protein, partial [Bacillus velezensis]